MNHASALSVAPVRQKRALDGVILLDKPTGITSQTAVLKVKRLFAAAKAGHTGTLDPMAGGLLPVCLGEATKFSHLLLDADKTYRATVKLGITTSTGDMEGAVIATAPVKLERSTAETVLTGFVGEIFQVPPMYSALKHAGKPLYEYARAGVDIARQARPVRIHRIDLERFTGDELHLSLTCSKGTYVRVLAEDIGRALGCGGCLCALTRTAVGAFTLGAAASLDAFYEMTPLERDARLLPVDSLVATLPRVDLDAAQVRRITTGLAVRGFDATCSGLVRIYGPGQRYLGVATVESAGIIVPRRLMATGTGRA